MPSILYKQENGIVKEFRVKASSVSQMLKDGYKTSPKDFEDIVSSDELSDKEIRAMAEAQGIKVARRSIKSIKKDLGI